MPAVTPKLLAFADPKFSWLLCLQMIWWMSIPSREATQPPGRCKPKTGASSSRKEFAPFRANSSLQSSTLSKLSPYYGKQQEVTQIYSFHRKKLSHHHLCAPSNPGPSPTCHHEEKTAALLITNPQPLVNHARTPLSEQAMFGQCWPNGQKRYWRSANVG